MMTNTAPIARIFAQMVHALWWWHGLRGFDVADGDLRAAEHRPRAVIFASLRSQWFARGASGKCGCTAARTAYSRATSCALGAAGPRGVAREIRGQRAHPVPHSSERRRCPFAPCYFSASGRPAPEALLTVLEYSPPRAAGRATPARPKGAAVADDGRTPWPKPPSRRRWRALSGGPPLDAGGCAAWTKLDHHRIREAGERDGRAPPGATGRCRAAPFGLGFAREASDDELR